MQPIPEPEIQVRAVELADRCGCRHPEVHYGVARAQLEIVQEEASNAHQPHEHQ